MNPSNRPPHYVVDTSVAVKWFAESDEADSQRARQLRAAFVAGRCALRAPELLPFELANTLRLGKRFSLTDVLEAVESIRSLGTFVEGLSWSVLRKAIEISAACEATVYDSYFLAMALESAAVLVTADEVFVRKARHYPGIVSLRQLHLPA